MKKASSVLGMGRVDEAWACVQEAIQLFVSSSGVAVISNTTSPTTMWRALFAIRSTCIMGATKRLLMILLSS